MRLYKVSAHITHTDEAGRCWVYLYRSKVHDVSAYSVTTYHMSRRQAFKLLERFKDQPRNILMTYIAAHPHVDATCMTFEDYTFYEERTDAYRQNVD